MGIETKKMTCVKCPITDEFDMIINCMRCSYSKNLMEKDEEFECLYEEKRRKAFVEDVHDYIMDEMEPWELNAYINKKAQLEYEWIDDTVFVYNPNEIDFDSDLRSYMVELAHCTSETQYRLEATNDDVLFKKEGNYYSY